MSSVNPRVASRLLRAVHRGKYSCAQQTSLKLTILRALWPLHRDTAYKFEVYDRSRALMSGRARNRVGGGLASAVLPHHRTSGSASGAPVYCVRPAASFVSCIVSPADHVRTPLLLPSDPQSPGTLAVQLTLTLVRCVENFHLQVSAPCRAHEKKKAP